MVDKDLSHAACSLCSLYSLRGLEDISFTRSLGTIMIANIFESCNGSYL